MTVTNAHARHCADCGRRLQPGDGRVIAGAVYCPSGSCVAGEIVARTEERLPDAQHAVLVALWARWQEHGRATVTELAADVGRNRSWTHKHLRRLIAAGRVAYDGRGTIRPAAARPVRYVRLIRVEDLR